MQLPRESDAINEQQTEQEVDLAPTYDGPPPLTEGRGRRVERTRALLAYLLLGLLAGIVGTLLAMMWRGNLAVDELSSAAGVLISPIVGLLGAATGYYYSRGDR